MLTTVARASTLLRTSVFDDDMLGLLIPAASAAIESYCKRKFGYNPEITEQSEAPGPDYILLQNYPIVAVASIDGKTALDGYTIDKKRGMVYREGWRCRKPVTTVYAAGYILPGADPVEGVEPLPSDLEYACILMIQAMGREPGVTSERVGDLAITYAQDDGRMPAAVRALAGPYRNLNV